MTRLELRVKPIFPLFFFYWNSDLEGSLVLWGRSGPRDLMLGRKIWQIYGKELLSIWWVCLGRIWTEGGFTLIPVSGAEWGGVKNCWNPCRYNFGLPNNFVTFLLCGFLVNNNIFFLKCAFFKRFVGYTDDGCYKNQNAYVEIIIQIKVMRSLCRLL
jgi:hypothetical protein